MANNRTSKRVLFVWVITLVVLLAIVVYQVFPSFQSALSPLTPQEEVKLSEAGASGIDSCELKMITSVPFGSKVFIGHPYGKQLIDIAPKVIDFLDINRSLVTEVILGGDVFHQPSLYKWTSLLNRYKEDFKIWVAPGNHDVGYGDNSKRDIFRQVGLEWRNGVDKVVLMEEGVANIIEDSTIAGWGTDFTELPNSPNINVFRHNIPFAEFLYLANSKAGINSGRPLKKISDAYNNMPIDIRGNSINFFIGDTGIYGQLETPCFEYKNITLYFGGIAETNKDVVFVIHKNTVFGMLI